jgi:hypothetical protein
LKGESELVTAVIIAEPEVLESTHAVMGNENSDQSPDVSPFAANPLACIEILGRSALDRGIDEFRRAGVYDIAFITDGVALGSSEGARSVVTDVLLRHKKSGIDWAFVVRPAAYVELDPLAMLHFHRNQRQPVTRAFDSRGALDIWLLDTNAISENCDLLTVLSSEPARYSVPGHVNRLENAGDFRQLAVDGLNCRWRLRPTGVEVRPGIWIEEGSQIHKRARIVGPAFIGRDTKIAEQCLITRGSNVESNCEVEYGTVVEDSSILADTYVGIGLDVSHSVINGNTLINLERDVQLEIYDPGMIRKTKVWRKDSNPRSSVSMVALTAGAFVPTDREVR